MPIKCFIETLKPEHLHKILELCGSPDESIWPGVSRMPWYNNFKPARPMRRCLREVLLHRLDPKALDLLDRMLTLDPSKRISAKDALETEYFQTEPLPCAPKCLPKYESSDEFRTKKKRQKQRLNEEIAKRRRSCVLGFLVCLVILSTKRYLIVENSTSSALSQVAEGQNSVVFQTKFWSKSAVNFVVS